MRFSLAILAAAANAATLELNSFNEAISSATETGAPSDTEKWEELLKLLSDDAQAAYEKAWDLLLNHKTPDMERSVMDRTIGCIELFSDPSNQGGLDQSQDDFCNKVADYYTYCSLIERAPKAVNTKKASEDCDYMKKMFNYRLKRVSDAY